MGMKENKRYLALCQDFLGMFDRSAAAKKGWETRKNGGGWDPKKGLKESGEKIPTWAGKMGDVKMPSPQNPAKSGKIVEEPSELQKAIKKREEYDRSVRGDMWDEGARNYFPRS